MFTIAVPDAADSSSTITLNNRVYEMLLTYNGRTESWYMSLLTTEGVFIIKGIKVIPDVPLLRRKKQLSPEGSVFMVFQTTDERGVKITRENFGNGKTFELFHFTLEEYYTGKFS